ncbi:MAG: hypothetical protein IKE76_05530, partial [Clostridia bacterium]|nr:hypothetical protein [Clostridia bacterium]
DIDHRTYTASGLKSGNTVNFDDYGKAKVLVRAQNSVTITGIPAGYTYTVEELKTAETDHFQLIQVIDADGEVVEKDGTTGKTVANGEIDNGGTDVVTVQNAHKVGGLTVSKTVVGDATGVQKFHFKVTLAPNAEVTSADIQNKYFGGMHFTPDPDNSAGSVYEFDLGNGESLTAKDIPTGTRFTVVETSANSNGFVTGVKLTTAEIPEGAVAPTVSGATVSGEIIEDGEGNKIAIITAYKNAHYEGAAYTPRITKSLVLDGTATAADGALWPAGGFEFTLHPTNAETGVTPTEDETATATAASTTATFGMLSFAMSSDNPSAEEIAAWATGKTFTYTITETIPDDAVNADGVKYSEAIPEQKAAGVFKLHGVNYTAQPVTLTVVVGTQAGEGNESLLEIRSVQYGTAAAATTTEAINVAAGEAENTVDDAGASVDLEATKALVGRDLTEGEFTFQLRQGDTVLQTKTNGATVTDEQTQETSVDVSLVKFDTITYTRADMVGATLNAETGKYEKILTYTIVEVAGEDTTVNYDAEPKTVTVKLVEEDRNTITATPTYPEGGAVFTNTAKTSVTVQKVWRNADGTATWPTGVTVTASLYLRTGDDDTTDTQEGIVDATGAALTGDALNKVLTESAASATWADLAMPGENMAYVVKETAVTGGTLGGDGVITVGTRRFRPEVDGTTITNTELTQIAVQKTWADGVWPEGGQVTVQLYSSTTAPTPRHEIPDPTPVTRNVPVSISWTGTPASGSTVTVTATPTDGGDAVTATLSADGWSGALNGLVDGKTYALTISATDGNATVALANSSLTVDSSSAVTATGTVKEAEVTTKTVRVTTSKDTSNGAVDDNWYLSLRLAPVTSPGSNYVNLSNVTSANTTDNPLDTTFNKNANYYLERDWSI